MVIKNSFKLENKKVFYSDNRVTNSTQLVTKIQYLQFQLITAVIITTVFIPFHDLVLPLKKEIEWPDFISSDIALQRMLILKHTEF